jgi:NAD(P)-dependent dehydrogenase (short-subunit alcohol dehydrogenase family)
LESPINTGQAKRRLNMTMAILAKEVQPRGISVVIFSPGWVQTDMGGAKCGADGGAEHWRHA